MTPRHRITHHDQRVQPPAAPRRALPFFEFMLYGADAFAAGAVKAPLVPVTRGRSLTLIAASRTPAPRHLGRHGA